MSVTEFPQKKARVKRSVVLFRPFLDKTGTPISGGANMPFVPMAGMGFGLQKTPSIILSDPVLKQFEGREK